MGEFVCEFVRNATFTNRAVGQHRHCIGKATGRKSADAHYYRTYRQPRRQSTRRHENLRLQNMWDGVETMAALLEME